MAMTRPATMAPSPADTYTKNETNQARPTDITTMAAAAKINEAYWLPTWRASKGKRPKRRREQTRMINEITKIFETSKDAIFCAPTGTGKTYVLDYFANKYKTAIFVTNSKQLQNQLHEELPDWYIVNGQANFECVIAGTCDKGGRSELEPTKEQESSKNDKQTPQDKTTHTKCDKRESLKQCLETYNKTGHTQTDIIKSKLKCPYQRQVFEGFTKPKLVINYHMFFAMMFIPQYKEQILQRGIILFDEAHKLDTTLMDFAGLSFPTKRLENCYTDSRLEQRIQKSSDNNPNELRAILDTRVKHDAGPITVNIVFTLYEKLLRLMQNNIKRDVTEPKENKDAYKEFIKLVDDTKDTARKFSQITNTIFEDVNSYGLSIDELIDMASKEYDRRYERIEQKYFIRTDPVYDKRHNANLKEVSIAPLPNIAAKRLLDVQNVKRLFVSGTLTQELVTEVLDTDSIPYAEIKKHPYRERFKIIYPEGTQPVTTAATKEAERDGMETPTQHNVDITSKIIRYNYPNERILMLTTSKTHCYDIYDSLNADDNIRHRIKFCWEGRHGKSREDIINEFKASKNDILLSPSLWEGTDFKDDICHVCFIMKLPSPFLGDNYYARLKNFEKHGGRDANISFMPYSLRTGITLCQGIGRCVRSKTDYCTIYMMDSKIDEFIHKAKYCNGVYIMPPAYRGKKGVFNLPHKTTMTEILRPAEHNGPRP